jgi:hypothetical protein
MTRRFCTLASAVGIALATGCTSWHQNSSLTEGVARAKSGEIRVNRVDGSMIRVVNAEIVGDSLIGLSPVTGARVSMPTSAVASTETKQVSSGRTAALGGGILLGAAAAAGILIIAILFSMSWG